MDYRELVQLIPDADWKALSDKLISFILQSKNEDKMPSSLANSILHHWQRGTIMSESGLAALLEAALLLELDKTVEALSELRLTRLAEKLKEVATEI